MTLSSQILKLARLTEYDSILTHSGWRADLNAKNYFKLESWRVGGFLEPYFSVGKKTMLGRKWDRKIDRAAQAMDAAIKRHKADPSSVSDSEMKKLVHAFIDAVNEQYHSIIQEYVETFPEGRRKRLNLYPGFKLWKKVMQKLG